MDTQLFINYRRSDTASFAEYLALSLTNQIAEGTYFLDTETIKKGEYFSEVIEKHLMKAEVLLVLIGPGWLDAADEFGERRIRDENDWVRKEIELAKEKGKHIIPIFYQNPDIKQIETYLSKRVPSIAFISEINYISIAEQNRKNDLQILISELIGTGKLTAKSTPQAIPTFNPQQAEEQELAHIQRKLQDQYSDSY